MKKYYQRLILFSLAGFTLFNIKEGQSINNNQTINNDYHLTLDEIIADKFKFDSKFEIDIDNTFEDIIQKPSDSTSESIGSSDISSDNLSSDINQNISSDSMSSENISTGLGTSIDSSSSSNEYYEQVVNVYLNPSVQTANYYVNNLGTEAKNMNDIVEYMVQELSDIEFIKLSYNLSYLPLKESVKQSNNLDTDIHFSLHSNAGGGSGSEIYTNPGNTHFAKYIYDKYTSQIGNFKKRGVKTTTSFYEIKNSTADHKVLLELLFHDNVEEATYIVNNKKKIAKILSQGIVDYIKEFYLNIY